MIIYTFVFLLIALWSNNDLKKMKIKLNKGFFDSCNDCICWGGQAQTTTQVKEPGINVSFFDNTVKPADNFFRFVNGTWLDETEIPVIELGKF
jgi:hypothetical protein